jgi:hypothetical protein
VLDEHEPFLAEEPVDADPALDIRSVKGARWPQATTLSLTASRPAPPVCEIL